MSYVIIFVVFRRFQWHLIPFEAYFGYPLICGAIYKSNVYFSLPPFARRFAILLAANATVSLLLLLLLLRGRRLRQLLPRNSEYYCTSGRHLFGATAMVVYPSCHASATVRLHSPYCLFSSSSSLAANSPSSLVSPPCVCVCARACVLVSRTRCSMLSGAVLLRLPACCHHPS
jgi:hypothetical protein